jgi:hypothetical protein
VREIDHMAKAAQLRRDAKHMRRALRRIAILMAETHELLAVRAATKSICEGNSCGGEGRRG